MRAEPERQPSFPGHPVQLATLFLAPLFTWRWPALSRAGREPSASVKFALGLIFMGLSIAILVPATRLAADGPLVSPAFLRSE
jgi:POT family proton-dependent oligopeptide transporter